MSGNRSKKNGKKNKFLSTNEVLQVKSVKLETNKSTKDGRPNSKSDDNFLRKPRKSSILKSFYDRGEEETMTTEGDATEPETSIVKKLKTLSLSNEGENNVPTTSSMRTDIQEAFCMDPKLNASNPDEELPLVMEYCPEIDSPTSENPEDEYGCAYKYYAKNTKSIKFTNQVTVLYFNGEDILCESMEPLKKEQEQQLRNKEMRKEHLMSKGPIDNLYLF